MNYWTALILGLAGSLHCAGMCGPLALALPNPGSGGARFLLGRLAYNSGRILTYTLLGVFFGLVGKSLVLAGVQRWASIALGISLLVGLISSYRAARATPIVLLVQRLKSAMSVMLRRRSIAALGLLGALNGLLPCGLVYVAGAGAVSTGGVAAGAGYMAVFGLGTIPLMLAIGLSGSLVPTHVKLKLGKAVPVSVALVATLLILRGMSLGIPFVSPDLSAGSCCVR